MSEDKLSPKEMEAIAEHINQFPDAQVITDPSLIDLLTSWASDPNFLSRRGEMMKAFSIPDDGKVLCEVCQTYHMPPVHEK